MTTPQELSKNFEPEEVEKYWTERWNKAGYFHSEPNDKPAFTVVIPPPNVTGVLHMGHTLNETVQDILVRRARMSGYNACWVPGSDHASIATESKVVQMLKERGIEKSSLTRSEFLKYAFEWKEKYGGIIYNQIERLGCSVDWNRTTFTMDEHYQKAVVKTFVKLYREGLIYRGARMINWDPVAKTALSDEEVEHKDAEGTLYYVKYRLIPADNLGSENPKDDNIVRADGEPPLEQYITIATQRPETIMGDAALCVHPGDERYKHLQGAYAEVPLIKQRVEIIFDEYVDPSFGTGVLKVTPEHDINDYNLALRHNGLRRINVLNDDGTMSAAAKIYVGMDRFEARKRVVEDLKAAGLLVKEEINPTRIGYSQRSGAVVEPRISTQWFLRMESLAGPALAAVVNGDIKIHPGDRFMSTYRHWLENVKDWCISRQLWWGQQIPAWYTPNGTVVVAETKEEAFEQLQNGKSLRNDELAVPVSQYVPPSSIDKITQDADVLDTWFSSWLWPMEVFNGITEPGNTEINYYYPTSVLVTGQDIIFFWVARMIMAGLYYNQEVPDINKRIPFKDVYFTGMVRDKQGRKMSKSLGNSPDLLHLIDTYGADAVRFGIMISSPAGNDLLFDDASLEQGRFFNNKLWNALKLVQMWAAQRAEDREQKTENTGEENPVNFAVQWFSNRLNQAKTEVAILIKQFRLSEALKVIYSLIWDDFCSWYLEWAKPTYGQIIAPEVYAATVEYFTELLALLHPYMPFITEEMYHLLDERKEGDDLSIRQNTPIETADEKLLADGEKLKQVITALREARVKNNLKQKDAIKLFIQTGNQQQFEAFESILNRQVNTSAIAFVNEAPTGTIAVVVDQDRFFIESLQPVDTSAQKATLQADLERQQRLLDSVNKKLGNEKFMQNAKPEVVALERQKESDAKARIKVIEESMALL